MQENIDLVSGSKKSFWKLAPPLMAFCVINSIYSLFDMVWVSKISVEAFFAIGISIPIIAFVYSCGDAVGEGTNSIMSRFIGSGDYESAYNALVHGLILANVAWFVLVLCVLFAHGILFYLNKLDSYILVFDYLVPMVVFAYLFIFVNIFSQTLQAEGNSLTPNVLIIISYVLNIILDPIFIFDLNLGVKGAAYATVLSTFFVFISLFYLYSTGRTKVPLSVKYFKFHSYIFYEIFKVALPNLLTEGVVCFGASLTNSVLIVTMGATGTILNSVCSNLRSLIVAPANGNTMALMTVSGHLFGDGQFDELNEIFKYVLKISSMLLLVILIVFFIFRHEIFGLFSITGMQKEIFWIALGGMIYVAAYSLSIHCASMYDGFGKSVYTLIFVFIQVILQIAIMYGLLAIEPNGNCVLIAMVVSEVLISIVFYAFLKHLFNSFNQTYDGKTTVKRFNNQSQGMDDKIDVFVEKQSRKVPGKLPLIVALVAMILIVLEIISIPLQMANYTLFIGGIASLILGGISIYLMEKLHKPRLSILGFTIISIILLVFMGRHGYVAALLFIVTAVLMLTIKRVIKLLKKLRLMN